MIPKGRHIAIQTTYPAARLTCQMLPPLIKWPGGKRELVKRIVSLLPAHSNTYYEPFLGGAALFFAMQPQKSVLSDSNDELINLYRQVRDSPLDLIRVLRKLKNSEKDYYNIRGKKYRSPIKRAARLLYLTTLSFNGIHRVNLKGIFNVPYGYKTHLPTYDEERILAASGALAHAKLKVADFQAATKHAEKGDIIYFDPPYTVAHANNGFLKYNEKIFSWNDQVRLAVHARTLAERGCHVVISNADHPSVRQLYDDFEQTRVERFSRIAASREHRKKIIETLYCASVRKP